MRVRFRFTKTGKIACMSDREIKRDGKYFLPYQIDAITESPEGEVLIFGLKKMQ